MSLLAEIATAVEMERVTKKKPPTYTTIKMIYGDDEEDLSESSQIDNEEVYYTLNPHPSRGVSV